MQLEPVVRIPVAISLGAIAGALSRYYLSVWLAQWLGTSFPYGTFVINLTGCLAMGFFVNPGLGAHSRRHFSRSLSSDHDRLSGCLYHLFHLWVRYGQTAARKKFCDRQFLLVCQRLFGTGLCPVGHLSGTLGKRVKGFFTVVYFVTLK